MLKSNKMLKVLIHRLAMTVRIGIENQEFTADEAMDFIREEAEKEFNRVLSLTKKELVIQALAELAQSATED